MRKIQTIILLFFLGLILISGCATTSITSTWKSPQASVKHYNKVMVVGIIREADRNIRERMEQHLVDDLRSLGYNAYSSYQIYGPKGFDFSSEEVTKVKLASDSIDAVLTIVLLDKQKERYYAPGRIVYSPYITYHNHFWGYYHSIYTRIESPGYYDVTTRYFWESNFYDLTTNQLIYSVQTQSFDPASVEGLAHEYGQLIIKNMQKNNVLGRQEAVIKAM